ncbi:MAG: prolipoprotein diacylglyceryl transferase [Candidatus Doudnabacteria bacterium RIFCSPHIGHO2_01_FULL_45_18]|uniref:Phosphatidylglycerol--prolipoprotein diacylglyceryl transferase n=1 Tax=Candidatus Doudnabacteria bacterium RIFCSPHIGHO2_01_FULL_45_18 TaxID=1817823 RepID=A0A1F5NRW0_9BACT|nr:MAG: prolipoprotein diacylglyceryl transferase [Candidatus Doudnabacteria bacterium RIFCSPHIGHO2_01_FULL_45_18]
MDPVLHLGLFQIHWYGVTLAAAILAAFFVIRRHAWKFGISVADIDDFSFWAVVVGLVGARLYYVIFSYDYFSQNLGEIYKIWHGGQSIYGAILAGLIVLYVYSRKKAYGFWQLFDAVALGLPLGQAIGRFGNFFNQEAYGAVTSLPWKMYVDANQQFHHPAFLYEAIWNIIIFFILFRLLGKVKSGALALSYVALYSLGRFFIEGTRVDSFFLLGFRVDQVVAFLLIVTFGWLIFLRQKAH